MKIRNGVDFLVWFAVSIALGILLSTGMASAQNHELTFGTSFISAPESGYEFPYFSNGIGGKVHLKGFEVGGGFSYGNFPKRGTPGGHRRAIGAFTNYWFGEHIYVGADWSNVFGDATIWTKEVQFAGVNAGIRFIGDQRLGEPEVRVDSAGRFYHTREVKEGRHEDRVSFSYDKEIKTDAIQPNNSEQFAVRWLHDFPLNGHMAIRSAVSLAYGTFDQFVFFTEADADGLRHRLPTGEIQRLSSTTVSFGISLLIH